MYKRDYKIIIEFSSDDLLFWDVIRKGVPHYVGNNKKELLMIKDACEEVIGHVNRLLNEKDKHQ